MANGRATLVEIGVSFVTFHAMLNMSVFSFHQRITSEASGPQELPAKTHETHTRIEMVRDFFRSGPLVVAGVGTRPGQANPW